MCATSGTLATCQASCPNMAICYYDYTRFNSTSLQDRVYRSLLASVTDPDLAPAGDMKLDLALAAVSVKVHRSLHLA